VGAASKPLEGRTIVINRLRYYDWSFSNTAEVAIGTLLVIAMVVTTLV
jgi:hypothetical protein